MPAPIKYPELQSKEWLHHHYIELEYSLSMIADKLGCDITTVGDGLKRTGVPARSLNDPIVQKQISKFNVGRHVSEYTRRRLREKLSGRKIGPLSDETKAKLSRANRKFTDEEEFSIIRAYKEGNSARIVAGQYGCSFYTVYAILRRRDIPRRRGNWKGGISFLLYSSEFNESRKERVRNRDGRECQMCGMTEKASLGEWKQRLNVHHIDHDKINCDEFNLIALCKHCNSLANFPQDAWMFALMELQLSRFGLLNRDAS